MCTVCVQYVYSMCSVCVHYEFMYDEYTLSMSSHVRVFTMSSCICILYCTMSNSPRLHNVQGYTMSKVTQCPRLHNVQSYKMSKVTQCPRLHNVQGYTLSIKCTSSQCPRRDNVNVCQMTMLMSILNIGPHVRSVREYTMYCLTCEMPSSEKAEMVLSRFRPILALLVMALQTELVPPCGRDYLVNQ